METMTHDKAKTNQRPFILKMPISVQWKHNNNNTNNEGGVHVLFWLLPYLRRAKIIQ